MVAARFAAARRAKLRSSLRYCGLLLAIAATLLGLAVWPLHAGWWDFALPAAIATGIAALLIFAVAVNAPLEGVAYLALYFNREHRPAPAMPWGFGRALYRASGRLDELAREAGLRRLSEFDSEDALETRRPPRWHEPAAALPTVEHLLAATPAALPLHKHLAWLRDALRGAEHEGANFYFMVLTWGGGTNSRVEAARHGDLSGIAAKADPQ